MTNMKGMMRNTNHVLRGILFIFHFSTFLFISGCATNSNDHPAWLLNPQTSYPETTYLVAVGEGDTRRAAENSAIAGLSRIFESRIHAEETLSETTTEARGGIERFDQLSELRANIHIGSDQDLLNIQFGESFIDHHGRVYVAALIPRAETAAIYRQRILEKSHHLIFLTTLSDAAIDPIARYAFRRAAVRKALENDRLIAQLDIIDPGSRDRLSLEYDPQALYSETAAAAQQITFSVQLPGAGGEALREILTGMGFSENEQHPVLTFSGTSSFEEIDLKRGALVFVRYHYNLETRTQDQKLVLALNHSRREGHLSFEEATARAERSLRRELNTEVSRELGDYFDRLASVN